MNTSEDKSLVILEIINHDPNISIDEIARLSALSRRTVQKYIFVLLNDRCIEAIGSKVRCYYIVTQKGLDLLGNSLNIPQFNIENKNSIMNNVINNKKPLLFISHKESDKDFVTPLCTFLEGLGFTRENMFCSSFAGFDIGMSEDILETLKNKFEEYDVQVLFVLSKDYYKSPVCLNEMGASWIKNCKYHIILLPGFDFGEINGTISKNHKGMKIDNASCRKKDMNDFYNLLKNSFKLKDDFNSYERLRDTLFDAIDIATPKYLEYLENSKTFTKAQVQNEIKKAVEQDRLNNKNVTTRLVVSKLPNANHGIILQGKKKK